MNFSKSTTAAVVVSTLVASISPLGVLADEQHNPHAVTDLIINWRDLFIEGDKVETFNIEVFESKSNDELVSISSTTIKGKNDYVYKLPYTDRKYLFKITPVVAGELQIKYAYTQTYNSRLEDVEKPAERELKTFIDGNNVKLRWDEIKGAARYRVEMFTYDSSSNQYKREDGGFSVFKTEHQFTNLTPGETYKFVISPRINFIFDKTTVIEKEITLK